MKTAALASLVLLHAGLVWAAPPAGFEGRVEALRKQIGVPGMAVAIVENDQVALAKGFGIKRLGKTDGMRIRFSHRVDRQGLYGGRARHSG